MATASDNTSPVAIQNELLCFCVNKAKTVPFETLVKICTGFYSGEKIQDAKEILWEKVVSVEFSARKDLRLVKRKATAAGAKEHADMTDILKALQVCDKEDTLLPQFYALDLGNIPPMSPDQVDMSVLLAQFGVMQQELRELKDAVQSVQAGRKQGEEAGVSWAQVASSRSRQAQGQATPAPQAQAARTSLGSSAAAQANQQNKPSTVQQENPQPADKAAPRRVIDEEGFIQVSKRKNGKNKMEVKGSSSSTLLKGVAAPTRKLDLFVGRLDMATTTEAVKVHVNWLLKEVGDGDTTVEEIVHCAEAYGYKGFKISVPVESVSKVLQPEGWPTHVSVRRYFQPKGSKGVTKSVKDLGGVKSLHRSASMGSVFVRS